jgi:hypothetical protein
MTVRLRVCRDENCNAPKLAKLWRRHRGSDELEGGVSGAHIHGCGESFSRGGGT